MRSDVEWGLGSAFPKTLKQKREIVENIMLFIRICRLVHKLVRKLFYN